jgi:hypothetical protein
MTSYAEARERVEGYLRQRALQQFNFRPDEIHAIYADPSTEMASLRVSDLTALLAGDPGSVRARNEAGLYGLKKVAMDLPEGEARTMVHDVIRAPYRAAQAALQIAAQLGARSDWSGADELEQIGEVIAEAGLLDLGHEDAYRAVADEYGISHDGGE